MKDIYKYIDYRAYLRDYFVENKAKSPAFSHMFFARKAGINSSGFVHLVINGKRNLTKPVLLKICRAIGLDNPQTEYFEDMVSFDQAKTQNDRQLYFERIASKRKSIQITSIEDQQYEFYSAWYHSAIREAITLLDNNSDPEAISKLLTPSVSPATVRKSLKLQEDLGILKKDEDGKYVQSRTFLSAGGAVRNLALVNYQKDMLKIALDIWEHHKTDEISMNTVTLSMPEDMVEIIRKEIRAFKDRLCELVGSDTRESERVYHLNIDFFPLTKAVKEGKK